MKFVKSVSMTTDYSTTNNYSFVDKGFLKDKVSYNITVVIKGGQKMADGRYVISFKDKVHYSESSLYSFNVPPTTTVSEIVSYLNYDELLSVSINYKTNK